MKTIYLVTGAAGFMGTNVCAQLLERGDAVRAFVLKGDPAVKFMPKAVEIFEGDLCSAEDCEKFFVVEPGVQTVCIHCASMVTINPNYSEKLIAVNVGGTENMLNAAKNHPECKKFVYVSSTGAIPELPKGESIHEVYSFVPYDDDRVVGWYSRSKAMATQKVLDAAADGLNACVVHPSGILGPNDPAIGQTTRTLIQILNGEMPIGMQGSFNLVDVRDLAAGPIDAYFDYKLGTLEYRSVRFENELLDKPSFQGNAAVNYTDRETPWTRIIEHKWFEFGKDENGNDLPKTIISREYSSEWKPGDEPYYPVNDAKNGALYAEYKKLADAEPKVIFGGRLGEYKYYDMDQVIAAVLDRCESELH